MNREELLGAQALAVEEVDTPEWGRVRVAELSAFERLALADAWAAQSGQQGPAANLAGMAMLVVRALVDEAGARVLRDDDWRALLAKNVASLRAAYDAAARLSGLGAAQEEHLLGESEPSQSAASSSP